MNGPLRGRGEHSPEMEAMFAARMVLNKNAVIYFAGVLACFILVLAITRLIAVLTRRPRLRSQTSPVAKPFIYSSRFLRRFLLRKVPGLPSAGHAWLCITFVALNIALMFKPLMENWTSSWMSHIGSRTGWLAVANICVTILLGLKNTPLAFQTGWSYERLNVFHRVVGYVALAMVAIHGATYTAHFFHDGEAARLRVVKEIYGMVAGGSMLVLVSAGVVLRRWRYELFYILHVSFSMVALVFLGLHQPDMEKSIVFITVAGAGIWVLDRLFRGAKVLFYGYDNAATVYPLPGGGTRVVVRRTPSIAKPGEHCFLWIPHIRLAEMHPFTIVSLTPLEFVVSSRGGFTRDLHDYAVNNPGTRLRASVDGPYGKRVDPSAYDTVVMIAGGSGASYPVSLALEMHRRAKLGANQRVVLVWVVRDHSRLQWYWNQLVTIRNIPNLSASVFITEKSRPSVESVSGGTSADPPAPALEFRLSSFGPHFPSTEETDVEKLAPEPHSQPRMVHLEDARTGSESDASSNTSSGLAAHIHGIPMIYGRPPVSSIVTAAVNQTGAGQKVLVLGCGPEGLMADVRGATARSITSRGPSIDLHCEKFAW